MGQKERERERGRERKIDRENQKNKNWLIKNRHYIKKITQGEILLKLTWVKSVFVHLGCIHMNA